MVVGSAQKLTEVGADLERESAFELSLRTCSRVSGVTQTWSFRFASRQTKPTSHVSEPYSPPPGLRRDAASRLSSRVRLCVSCVTQSSIVSIRLSPYVAGKAILRDRQRLWDLLLLVGSVSDLLLLVGSVRD